MIKKKDVFEVVANTYDDSPPLIFSMFGEELVHQSEPIDCISIIDIACGNGAATLPLARIAKNSNITGVDASPGMLRNLRQRCCKRGFHNVRTLESDVHHLNVPSKSFDRAYLAMSLFYFENPEEVLEEIKRILCPNGKIFMSTWAQENDMIDQVLRELMGADYANIEKYIALDYGTTDQCYRVLQERGFENINVNHITLNVTFQSAEHWWQKLWTHGARLYLERLEKDLLAAFKKTISLMIKEKFARDDGLCIPVSAIISSAQKNRQRRTSYEDRSPYKKHNHSDTTCIP